MKNLTLILLAVVAIGCDDMQKTAMNVIREPAATEIADVLIYTRITWWITPTEATAEAEITKQLLVSKGIKAEITESELYVRDWMRETNANGSVNVLILYGVMPNTIYPGGNNLSDASVAEKWIETPDGDTILNHADYFAYSFSEVNATQQGTNGIRALQNLMDFPVTISVSDYNRPMIATPDGNALTPSLTGFESDRPFPLRQLQGAWFAEKVFASDTGNTQANYADPVILRDGDLGRLAIVHQTRDEDNPKGEVAAEIIINTLFADKPVSIIAEPAEPVPTTQDTNVYSQYDVNQDGTVDQTDLALVSAALGQSPPTNRKLDVDGNGTVSGSDIILVSKHLDATAPPTEEPTPVASQPLEITFENAFDLTPGIYRFRPNSYNSRSGDLGDDVITGLLWGSVGFGEVIEGSPPDAPKLSVYIELNPQPYEKMLNGKLAIEFERLADGTVIVDELLVEIGEKLREGTEQGGERGNRFTFTEIVYQGVALENLTHPDRAFEYE